MFKKIKERRAEEERQRLLTAQMDSARNVAKDIFPDLARAKHPENWETIDWVDLYMRGKNFLRSVFRRTELCEALGIHTYQVSDGYAISLQDAALDAHTYSAADWNDLSKENRQYAVQQALNKRINLDNFAESMIHSFINSAKSNLEIAEKILNTSM